MNILILGSGGREHAITWALSKSPQAEQLYVAPGNGGTAGIAENVAGLDIEDGLAVLEFVRAHDVQLVVIGPEAPLVAGVADVLRQGGVAVFGPGFEGARLEGSKTFSKEFMARHNLPTAGYLSTSDAEEAHAYIDEHGAPIVVKADGLAAGKGVVVAATAQEAHAAVDACMDGAFGDAGATVVVEECLTGPSALCLRSFPQEKPTAWRLPKTTSAPTTATRAPTRAAWAPIRPCPSSRTTSLRACSR